MRVFLTHQPRSQGVPSACMGIGNGTYLENWTFGVETPLKKSILEWSKTMGNTSKISNILNGVFLYNYQMYKWFLGGLK